MILDVLNVCDFDAIKLHILEYFTYMFMDIWTKPRTVKR